MDSLRSALQPVLQPVTHNLPQPIRDLGLSIIGERCYSSLVLDIDLADSDCLKLAVSKALGTGIVAASSIVKVPQIVNLVRSRSASGVSLLSYLLETSSYLVSLAYNVRSGFPFSTYGETALILGQNVVITALVLNYSGRAGAAALFVAALAGALGALFTEGVVDQGLLGYLQAGAGTLGIASKVPQILAIWQQGSTGQLSAFTVCFVKVLALSFARLPFPSFFFVHVSRLQRSFLEFLPSQEVGIVESRADCQEQAPQGWGRERDIPGGCKEETTKFRTCSDTGLTSCAGLGLQLFAWIPGPRLHDPAGGGR